MQSLHRHTLVQNHALAHTFTSWCHEAPKQMGGSYCRLPEMRALLGQNLFNQATDAQHHLLYCTHTHPQASLSHVTTSLLNVKIPTILLHDLTIARCTAISPLQPLSSLVMRHYCIQPTKLSNKLFSWSHNDITACMTSLKVMRFTVGDWQWITFHLQRLHLKDVVLQWT